MSVTPAQLWNSYSNEKRACISCYYDYDDYTLLETSFPDIECVFFAYVDRGVYDWIAFGSALKKWFPSLKTLLLWQNYTYKQDTIRPFMMDPWLDNIWINTISYDSYWMKRIDSQNGKIRIYAQDDTEDGIEPDLSKFALGIDRYLECDDDCDHVVIQENELHIAL